MNTKILTGAFDCRESCLKHIRQQCSIFFKWIVLPYILKIHSQHPRVFELARPGFSGLVPTLSAHTAVAVCPDRACHTSKICVNVLSFNNYFDCMRMCRARRQRTINVLYRQSYSRFVDSVSYPVNSLGFTRVRGEERDCKASQCTAPRYQPRPELGRTDLRVAPRYACSSSGCATGVTS